MIEVPQLGLKLKPLKGERYVAISQFGVKYYLLVGRQEINRENVEAILNCHVWFDRFMPYPCYIDDQFQDRYVEIANTCEARVDVDEETIQVWICPKEELDKLIDDELKMIVRFPKNVKPDTCGI